MFKNDSAEQAISNQTETIVHHANHSFRAYVRWRVEVICPSPCTCANVHTTRNEWFAW